MSAICQQFVRGLDETSGYQTSPNDTSDARKPTLIRRNGQLRTPADNYGESPTRSSSPPSDTTVLNGSVPKSYLPEGEVEPGNAEQLRLQLVR